MKKTIASVLSVMFIAVMSAASNASPVIAPDAADSASTPAAAQGAESGAMRMEPSCGKECIQEGGYCCGAGNAICCL